jgi:hypothetical protein
MADDPTDGIHLPVMDRGIAGLHASERAHPFAAREAELLDDWGRPSHWHVSSSAIIVSCSWMSTG